MKVEHNIHYATEINIDMAEASSPEAGTVCWTNIAVKDKDGNEFVLTIFDQPKIRMGDNVDLLGAYSRKAQKIADLEHELAEAKGSLTQSRLAYKIVSEGRRKAEDVCDELRDANKLLEGKLALEEAEGKLARFPLLDDVDPA